MGRHSFLRTCPESPVGAAAPNESSHATLDRILDHSNERTYLNLGIEVCST